LRLAVFCVLGLFAGGCREPLIALSGGTALPSGRAHAEQLFAALGARVTDPARDQKYDSARVRIANAAFLPSRVWDDTVVWTGSTSSRRSLQINGRLENGRYRLEAARLPAPVVQLADSRHVINLTRLTSDEYVWDTDVGYAIGGVTAPQVGAFLSALIAAAEGRGEKEIRSDYRAAIPLASAALGQLFSVDSIRTVHLADRSTLATFAISMNPANIEPRYPNFARYLRRYAETARMHWRLMDRGGARVAGDGATYLDYSLAGGRALLRIRTLSGVLVPLSGLARPMPDSLALHGDFTMKVRRFTMGFRGYHAELNLIRTDHERAWSLAARTEPSWVLPFVTERFLRAPLRRPFQGSGALFRIGVRDDSTGGQSLLHRRMHLEVQESTVLRFIGRLGAIAVSDYAGLAEREQNAWMREVFAALVTDVRALTF
jgi:hypothetical protein